MRAGSGVQIIPECRFHTPLACVRNGKCNVNRKTMHVGAVTVMAALAFGVGGTAAHAAIAQPVRAEVTSATLTQRQAVQQLAANLLKYEGNRFNAQERAELQAIADGTAVERPAPAASSVP